MSKSISRKAYLRFKAQLKTENEIRVFRPYFTLNNIPMPNEKEVLKAAISQWFDSEFVAVSSAVHVHVNIKIDQSTGPLTVNYTTYEEPYFLFEENSAEEEKEELARGKKGAATKEQLEAYQKQQESWKEYL